MRPLRVLQETRVATREESGVLGFPSRRGLTPRGKSRDFTLPTKVRLVKAMVFPVVMYGCERCTVKKAERRRIDAFDTEKLESTAQN